MAPITAWLTRPARHQVAAHHAPYPREVMEAGWVPEVVKLAKLLRSRAAPSPHREDDRSGPR